VNVRWTPQPIRSHGRRPCPALVSFAFRPVQVGSKSDQAATLSSCVGATFDARKPGYAGRSTGAKNPLVKRRSGVRAPSPACSPRPQPGLLEIEVALDDAQQLGLEPPAVAQVDQRAALDADEAPCAARSGAGGLDVRGAVRVVAADGGLAAAKARGRDRAGGAAAPRSPPPPRARRGGPARSARPRGGRSPPRATTAAARGWRRRPARRRRRRPAPASPAHPRSSPASSRSPGRSTRARSSTRSGRAELRSGRSGHPAAMATAAPSPAPRRRRARPSRSSRGSRRPRRR